ncbi:MAG: hypothetical protein EZS28_030110 [Streblomastix strix]|uniref:Uncharacterized protein n=1 Tax=Streblomastix strix TaxID=222440 RepID=A0A5J4UVQ3_9EUKA|nr:MAG: hypothetical protein EZS28_030110 [Streblomastix strix]
MWGTLHILITTVSVRWSFVGEIGQIRKELSIFLKIDTEKKKQLSRGCFKTIQLPPSQLIFTDLRSASAYSLAKTAEEQLWSRGMKDDGTWDVSEQLTMNSHFNAPNGLITSSVGLSRIRNFCFELHTAVIILENGAVFAYGQIQEFQSWDNIAADGFIVLTDSSRLKLRFDDELRGSVPGGQGPFGIFGTFHVVQYFRRMNAFLTDQGVVIDYAKELAGPVVRTILPFKVNELVQLILTKKTHVTALRDNGILFSISFEDQSVQDVTGYATKIAKIKSTDPI